MRIMSMRIDIMHKKTTGNFYIFSILYG